MSKKYTYVIQGTVEADSAVEANSKALEGEGVTRIEVVEKKDPNKVGFV